jgi:putative ATP-dependent endonuclease of OLD family
MGNCATTGPSASRTEDDVAAFCRFKSTYKVRAAIAVSNVLDEAQARKITSIESLLADVTGA